MTHPLSEWVIATLLLTLGAAKMTGALLGVPALEGVAVIVENFFERTLVDDGLIAFQTDAFFPFVGHNGHAAKFNSLNCLPGFFIQF